MGPWLCSHGNFVDAEAALSDSGLQWGRGCVATEMTSYVFAFSPIRTASMGPWLCSHGNDDDESDTSDTDDAASMGPWLCSHGNMSALCLLTLPAYSFNGAVAV